MTKQLTLLLAASVAIAGCTANISGTVQPGATSSPGAAATSSPTTGASTTPAASPAVGATGTVTAKANFDFPVATVVSPGQTIASTADTSNSQFYKVTIPAGTKDGVLKLTTSETNPDWNPLVNFYGNDKTKIEAVYGADGTQTPNIVQEAVTQGQTYYFSLNNADGKASDYTIKVEFSAVPDANEPNNDFDTATALTLGSAVPFYLFAGFDTLGASKSHDADFFKLSFPAGKTKLHVVAKDNSSNANGKLFDNVQQLKVQLFDSTKSSIGSLFAAGSQANLDQSFDLTAAGTYYLEVTDSNDANSLNAHSLTVTAE